MRKFLIAIGLLLTLAVPARAFTPYFVGAEDIDLSPTSANATIDTTAGHFRATWARSDFQSKDNNTAIPYWTASNKFSAASFWLSARVFVSGPAQATVGTMDWIRFTDSSAVPRLMLRIGVSCSSGLVSPGCLTLWKETAAGAYTQLGSAFICGFSAAPATPDKLDIQVSAYGVSGTVNVYINGALCNSYSGDIHTDSATALTGFQLGSASNSSTTAYVGWSEIIVGDTDTRGLGVATLAPAGTGNANAWTCTGGTPAASVNTVVNSDASNCSAATQPLLQQFTTSSLPSGNYSVAAVVTSVRSAVGSSGPQTIKHNLRVAGVDFFSTAITQSTTLLDYQNVWTTNPNTSAPWATTDLGAGFNIGVQSQP